MATPSVDDASPPRRRRRRWLPWAIAGAVILLVTAASAWVTTRALAARDELVAAERAASNIPQLVAARDQPGLATAAADFADHAAQARADTGDPVWRAAELIPWLGQNLVAVREVSEIADQIATGALPQLTGVASVLDPAVLAPRDGMIDTAPLSAAAPALHQASATLTDAAARVDRIPQDTVAPISDAVGKLASATRQAAQVVGIADNAATLLPGMLGASGPRTYLLLMLNNAELRTQGGIPGAVAELRADGGRISIVATGGSGEVAIAPEPAIPLSDATTALFDTLPGRYIQDVTMPIDVAEGGRAAKALWERTHSDSIDGVITVDTRTAAYLLQATGPVTAGPLSVNADNVLDILLSQVYAEVQDPQVLDTAYGALAAAIFHAAFSGEAKPDALLGALSQSVSENRVHVWSSHDDEQSVLAQTRLGSLFPSDEQTADSVGVFVNNVSSGKLDYYARAAVDLQTATCDGQARLRVSVEWTDGTPADALTTLPWYVTVGNEAGATKTSLTVTGPSGWTPVSYSVDGVTGASRTALLDDRVAIQQTFSTPFQSTRQLVVEFAAPTGASTDAPAFALVTTPMVRPMTQTTGTFTCEARTASPSATPAS